MKRIPKRQYAAIVANVPILCVDLIVTWRDRHLLVRRKNEPLKGAWWVPGGRVRRGERLAEAAVRLLEQETGLDGLADVPERHPGTYEGFFARSAANPKTGIHTVSVVYRMRLPSCAVPSVRLDSQSSAYKWAKGLPEVFVRNLTTL